MNEEELDSIQELIERKLLMAEVMGGLTSHDKKFIDLWNYTIQLQNNWHELKKWVIEQEQKAWDEVSSTFDYVLNKMQEMEEEKDERG